MTDEIEEAVARAIWDSQDAAEDGDWEITKRVCGKDNWEVEECYQQARAAIAAHKSTLAKAGMGIRPRVATVTMCMATAAPSGDQADNFRLWQAMWDVYERLGD